MALYAFDGTWNREHDQAHYDENSNVVRFAKAYRATKSVFQKKDDAEHVVENDNGYHTGPGTKHGIIGKFFGGLTGLGARSRVTTAVERVERKFREEGDYVIDVIGFSRGAAIALHFVNKLAKIGHLPGKDGQPQPIRVRFLGLWDTVAAFGIPRDIGPFKFHKINLFWDLTLPAIVDHCFHALALDERRSSFQPTRLAGSYEVWFRGVHSDIGGGNANVLRNNIALRWMMCKALAVGVPVDSSELQTLTIKADAAIGENRDLILDPFRDVLDADHAHYTVQPLPGCRDLPAGCPRETEEFERSRKSLRV